MITSNRNLLVFIYSKFIFLSTRRYDNFHRRYCWIIYNKRNLHEIQLKKCFDENITGVLIYIKVEIPSTFLSVGPLDSDRMMVVMMMSCKYLHVIGIRLVVVRWWRLNPLVGSNRGASTKRIGLENCATIGRLKRQLFTNLRPHIKLYHTIVPWR